jgi:dCMP deaminase
MKTKTAKAVKKKTAEAKVHARPSWDEYFLGIMTMVGGRATCDRGRSGCVIVKNKRILATGYVGSPIGAAHCDEVGHEMHKVVNEDGTESQHCVRTIHAEQNAIAQAARIGIALEGGTLYCKMTPCYTCAKMIVNAGIVRVVASKDYHASEKTKKAFREADVKFDLVSAELEKYENQ